MTTMTNAGNACCRNESPAALPTPEIFFSGAYFFGNGDDRHAAIQQGEQHINKTEKDQCRNRIPLVFPLAVPAGRVQ